MGEKNIQEMSTEKMELVNGGVSDLSQEDVDTLASLLKMYSKSELIDIREGICPKCKKKIADKSDPSCQAIVSAHYASCKEK